MRRFREGNEIGDPAMGLPGDFAETTAYAAEGKLDIPSMLKNTKKYLIEGKENICEAAFSKNGHYCDDMTFSGDFGEKEVIGPAENSKIQKSVYRVRCAFFCMAEKNCRSSLCGRKLKSRSGRCGRALSYRGACAQRICGKARSDRKGRFLQAFGAC